MPVGVESSLPRPTGKLVTYIEPLLAGLAEVEVQREVALVDDGVERALDDLEVLAGAELRGSVMPLMRMSSSQVTSCGWRSCRARRRGWTVNVAAELVVGEPLGGEDDDGVDLVEHLLGGLGVGVAESLPAARAALRMSRASRSLAASSLRLGVGERVGDDEIRRAVRRRALRRRRRAGRSLRRGAVAGGRGASARSGCGRDCGVQRRRCRVVDVARRRRRRPGRRRLRHVRRGVGR